jgi:DNA helicase HerA-like ATPase
MYIIGKTGTGKSTLIENMIISDIQAGNGLALVDPHGDLAENILHYIPKERIEDVIYFNPADIEYPIAFNPLEKSHPDTRHLIASGFISVFKKLWQDFWGPRLEHVLRNSIMALLEYPQATLLDLPRFLTDDAFRKKVLQSVTHPQVREFWFYEFERYSRWFRSEATSPILNKIGQFLTSLPVRNIVGQKETAFNLRSVLDERKILIINLAKGKIGEDSSTLLGAMLVTKIQLAALSRADLLEQERVPFYLYVDEVHNFLTESFADILSESRKYGLRLILAHQYIDQLEKEIREAIFGNVGTIISFRVGAKDARYLSREFHPVFRESDLINLPNHQIYLKLMIDGFTAQAFSAITLAPFEKGGSYREEIVEVSRRKYGRQRKEVEKEILYRKDL